MKQIKHLTQSRHALLALNIRAALLAVLMIISATQFAHAGNTTDGIWNSIQMGYGQCGLSANNSFPLSGLNNSGATPFDWSSSVGVAYTFNGNIGASCKQIVMSVWEHNETVPAYTKRTVTWKYQHKMGNNPCHHGSAIYFFNSKNSATNTSVDCTYNLSNGSGSSYRSSAHTETTECKTLTWDETATLEFNNSPSASQQTVGKYLLLTDIIGNAGSAQNSNNWAGFKSISWEATDTYYNDITFDSNGGTGTMEPQIVGGGEKLRPNTFTREGYTFMGWSDDPDARTATYYDKQAWNIKEEDKGTRTLYAVWGDPVTFTHSELRYFQSDSDSPEYRNFSDLKTDYATSNWYKSNSVERTEVGNSGTLPMIRNMNNPAIVRYNSYSAAEDCFDWFYLTASVPSYTKINYEVSFIFRPYNYSANGVRFAVFDYGSDYDKWNSRACNPNGNTSFRTATGMSTEAMYYDTNTYDGEFGAEYVYNFNTGYMWEWNYSDFVVDNSNKSTSDTSKAYYGLSCSQTRASSAYSCALWLGIELSDAVYTYYNNVIFNANGGSGNMENDIVTKDDAISQNTFTREGREFLGWNDNANGKVATYADEQTWGDVTRETRGEKNLYALWINRGDADTDEEFTINDFNLLKNYILGTAAIPAQNTLYFQNADANKDGGIDASDCQMIPELIFTAGANKAKGRMENGEWRMENNADAVEGFSATVNGDELTISAGNAQQFLACQMDIQLPKGVSINRKSTDGKHTIDTNVLANGMTRLLITSPTVNAFNNNKVVTLKLTGNASAISIENAIFTNKAFQSVKAGSGETTSINNEQLIINNSNGKFLNNNRVIIKHNGKKYNAAGQEMK